MATEFIGLLILILLSAFFSSSELAFVVANKIKIEIRARKNNFAAKQALFFINKPQNFFSTILIMNNIINIAFASLITIVLTFAFGWNEFEILAASSIVLLLFGELIPKYLAREFADSFIIFSVVPIRIVYFLIYPAVKVTALLSNKLTRPSSLNEETISHLFDKEDLQFLLNESYEAGNVGEDESDIINKVMHLSEQRVYEAMTPRTDIVGIEISSTIEEALKIFIDSGYSKLPVYEENLDNIKGVVFAYDMFRFPKDLNSVVREVVFVPDSKKTLEMLNEFLEKRVSIAIVIDEFGGTAGIVTVEDIIEEMLGEIKDEYDVDEHVFKQVDNLTYVVSGKVEIDYINEEYDLKIPEGDYETIGGYITSQLGRIPDKGETITIEHLKIVILRSDKTRIDLMKLYLDPEKYEELSNQ